MVIRMVINDGIFMGITWDNSNHRWMVISSFSWWDDQGPHGHLTMAHMNSYRLPGLVNVNKKLWKITIFNGKIHYFYGHFSIANC
jgi:hypothetical protein